MHTSRGRVVLRQRAKRLPLIAIGLLTVISTMRSSGEAAVTNRMTLVGYGSSVLQTQTASGAPTAPDATPLTTAAFFITGRVLGLYPGVTLPLVLTVTNPNKFSITVTSITTTVRNASSTCLAANVKVTSFSGAAVVAARNTAHVTVHTTMAHGAGDACQRAVFPFHYRGVATGA
jgi:hypothetical protein